MAPRAVRSKERLKVLAVVLAAGKGTRMRSSLPKVLHELRGKPLLGYVLDAIRNAGIKRTVVVVGYGEKQVRSFLKTDRLQIVRQWPPKGTGHAVLCAEKYLRHWKGLVLVMPGDAPLVTAESLKAMLKAHQFQKASATVLTAHVKEPHGYGRIIRRAGQVAGIREELDATSAERRIHEINSGIYLFDAEELMSHVRSLKAANQKKEYYLTDTIALLAHSGQQVAGYQTNDAMEVLGINSRQELSQIEKAMNQNEIVKHQKNGVTIISPENTFIAKGVKIGRDTVIYPFTWIEKSVRIGERCQIGPFSAIRQGTQIEKGATVGSFVELVRSRIGKQSRVKHLTYLGDAVVGADVNIGAGTVTANYDGKGKHQTHIRQKAFIGSNTVLVAPVTVGERAKTGAGAVVLSGSRIGKGQTVAGVPAKPIQRGKRKK